MLGVALKAWELIRFLKAGTLVAPKTGLRGWWQDTPHWLAALSQRPSRTNEVRQ